MYKRIVTLANAGGKNQMISANERANTPKKAGFRISGTLPGELLNNTEV